MTNTDTDCYSKLVYIIVEYVSFNCSLPWNAEDTQIDPSKLTDYKNDPRAVYKRLVNKWKHADSQEENVMKTR